MRPIEEVEAKIQELLKKGRVTIDIGDLSSTDKIRELNDTLKEINGKVEALMWVQGMLEDL